jgi:hypothetical protein
MLLLLFIAKHVAVLLVMFVAALAAGTLVAGGDEPRAMRAAIGLAAWGEALFVLAVCGWLRGGAIAALFVATLAGAWWRARSIGRSDRRWMLAFIAIGAPLFLLALQPPLAFDETMYHLPFVRSLARHHTMQFLPELRFAAFPQLHELLCVPAVLLAGETAAHLTSVVEAVIIAGVIAEWARRDSPRAAPLAAALFIGSPIIVHLAAILYVDLAVTLFVVAGFYALDVAFRESRRAPLLFAGLLFGAACSVKYTGGFFAVAALVIVVAFRRREALRFAMATATAALPTTLWIARTTGNPLFPFLPRVFGRTAWTLPPVPVQSLTAALRVAWDVTFARDRMNGEPPVTPLLIAMLAVVAASALRDTRARILLLLAAAYLVPFSFLPRETRYLMPLLSLFCVAAAVAIAQRWPRLASPAGVVIAAAPGVAYLAWRLALAGLPPATPAAVSAVTAARVPGYRALLRAGAEPTYVCGAEQFQAFATGPLYGDFAGRHPYAAVLDGDTLAQLRALRVTYLLVVKQACPPRPRDGMTLVYEDAGAQLWRVQPGAPR